MRYVNVKDFFISFLLCVITVSCKEDALMSPIAIPEIVDTSMDISGTDIVLSGKVSDGDRIKSVDSISAGARMRWRNLSRTFPLTKNSLSH